MDNETTATNIINTLATSEEGEKAKKDSSCRRIASYAHAQPNLLIETVYEKGPFEGSLNYIVWNGNGGGPKVYKKGYRLKGESIRPPNDKGGCVSSGSVCIATGPGPLLDTKVLIEELREFVGKYMDFPKFQCNLAAYYALSSWVYDRFTALGYLRLLGNWSTGKSRFLDVVGALSYKAVRCAGADSTATLFRDCDTWQGTLIIDEADFQESGAKSEIAQILNNGYKRGGTVGRQEKDGSGFYTRRFHVYGPKVLATREAYGDDGLESRCITLESTRLVKLRDDIPRSLPLTFEDEAIELRNKLLSWRAANWSKVDSSVAERELLKIEPRAAQIATPLFAVAQDDEEFKSELVDFLRGRKRDSKLVGQSMMVVEALRELMDSTVSVGEVGEMVRGNASENGDEQVTDQKIGAILRGFGFEAVRDWGTGARGRRVFKVEKGKVEELMKRFEG